MISQSEAVRARRGQRVAEVLPALLLLAGAIALGLADGAVAPTTYYPVGLGVLALAALVAALAPPRPDERSGVWELALLAFGAWTAWQFASMLWADSPGDAWDGANRSLIFLLALWVAGARRFRGAGLRAAVGGAGAAGALLAAGVLLHLALHEDPAAAFLEGRLATPIQYVNGNASLFLIAFFPALALSLARGLPLPARAAGLGAATLLLQTALLAQSRGALLGFAVAAVVLVACSSRRLVTLAALAVPVAATAIGFDAITDVRNAADVDALGAELDGALRAIVLGSLAATAVGAVACVAGPRAPAALRTPRARRVADGAVVALAAAAVIAAVAVIGNPATWLDDRWEDFKTSGYSEVEAGESRFSGSLGSSRYDFWRVALDQFGEQPLLGAGADNYAADYLAQRRSLEAPRHPHGLPFKVLGQTGLIGALTFGAFALLAAFGAAAACKRLRGSDRALAAGAFGGWTAWFAHGQVDWLYEFTSLSLFALGLLAVAVRALPEEPAAAVPSSAATPAGPVRAPALVAAGLLLATSLAAPGAAARFTDHAVRDFAVDPQRTLDRLRRAESLNPLSARAPLTRGVLARRLGRLDEARSALTTAIRREPRNWFAHLELGLVGSQQEDTARAVESLERAAELNPRQPVVDEVLAAVRAGEEVDPRAVEEKLSRQLQGRLRSVDED